MKSEIVERNFSRRFFPKIYPIEIKFRRGRQLISSFERRRQSEKPPADYCDIFIIKIFQLFDAPSSAHFDRPSSSQIQSDLTIANAQAANENKQANSLLRGKTRATISRTLNF